MKNTDQSLLPTRLCESKYHTGERALPNTDEFFKGPKKICRACKNRYRSERSKKLVKAARSVLMQQMFSDRGYKKSVPHGAEAVQRLVLAGRGMEAIASEYWEVYKMAKEHGSVGICSKMLENQINWIMRNSESGHATKPIGLMSLKEIRKELGAELASIMESCIKMEDANKAIEKSNKPKLKGMTIDEVLELSSSDGEAVFDLDGLE